MNMPRLTLYVNQYDEVMTQAEVIEHLEDRLKEAEAVIGFYGDMEMYADTHKAGPQKHFRIVAINDCEQVDEMVKIGGKRAREYQAKWSKK